jgi:hypothetical protein
MSVVWTKAMAERFMCEYKPDSMFPCSTEAAAFTAVVAGLETLNPYLQPTFTFNNMMSGPADSGFSLSVQAHALSMISDDPYVSLTICKPKCANCNCRMLFAQLSSVMADLETAKEDLKSTNAHVARLEEERERSAEEKRKYTGAIAKMVQREMSDVRDDLNYIQNTFGLHSEKALAEKASSEAAKAALSASQYIKAYLFIF